MKIAIIGAGTAGIIQAIALSKVFGSEVEIHIFEKLTKEQWSKRGIELSVGAPLQIALFYLGMDIGVFQQSCRVKFLN